MMAPSSSDAESNQHNHNEISPPKHVVIAGAGVIGLSTAYYLHKMFGISTTIVDPTGTIAPAASGKAGGFLALDWNDGGNRELSRLARRSFQLHQELADTFGPDQLQYRRLTCAAISVTDPNNNNNNLQRGGIRRPKGKKLQGIEWAGGDDDSVITDNTIDKNNHEGSSILGMRVLGDENTIAQVHPKMLCETLWRYLSTTPVQEGEQPGSRLVQGTVTSVVYQHEEGGNDNHKKNDGKTLVGAKLGDGTILQADAVLFACGPWTANIMTGVKYHSVVIPTDRVLSQCVFFSGCGDLEVYVRPDSTAYCTAFPDDAVIVTERPGQEQVRPDAIQQIVESARLVSTGTLSSHKPQTVQACYLPTTPDQLPIMGKVPSHAIKGGGGGGGCYVAAGHSCWGILLGPATGESMAQFIATGHARTDHVDLQAFDPARFRNLQMVTAQL